MAFLLLRSSRTSLLRKRNCVSNVPNLNFGTFKPTCTVFSSYVCKQRPTGLRFLFIGARNSHNAIPKPNLSRSYSWSSSNQSAAQLIRREVKIFFAVCCALGVFIIGSNQLEGKDKVPLKVSELLISGTKAKVAGNVREAERKLIQAKNIVDTSTFNESYKLKVNYLLGNFYYETNELQQAEKYYMEVVVEFQRGLSNAAESKSDTISSNQKDAFIAYSRLAELSHDRKDFERAERLYLQSLDVLMSPSDLSNTYQIWLKSMNGKKSADFGEPIKYIDSNLRKKLLEHGRNIAGVLNNLSVLYSEQSKEESAQAIHDRCEAVMYFSSYGQTVRETKE